MIPAPRRLRQEDCGFQASLGYTMRPSLKKKSRKENRKEGKYTSMIERDRGTAALDLAGPRCSEWEQLSGSSDMSG